MKPGRKTGGREARLKARAPGAPKPSPSPPGQTGGRYTPLTGPEVQRVLDEAYRILAEIGMGNSPPEFTSLAVDRGAAVTESGRLLYSRSMVEDIIDGAAKTFVFHGQRPERDIEIGGDRVFYGTGGAAVQTLDLRDGRYRPSTLRDLYDFARLADLQDSISWFTRCCIATDIADPFELDVNTAYAAMAGTDKPIGVSFTLGAHVKPIVEMFDAALDGEGEFKKRPFCKAHVSPVISPLRYGEDAIEVARECVGFGVPINAIIAAQSGATAPAPLAGMLAQSTAETMAALVMVSALKPGHPMIFSNWPFVIDLRTGAFAGSGGEITLLNAAAAQLGNALGLPTGVAAAMSDSKAVDAQMGAEKSMSSLATGLAGANLVYESAGMTASLLGASFEAMVADNETLAQANRILRGIEVSDDTLGFGAIREAVEGPGHFLGSSHTLESMERDYCYPELADRADPVTWAESGSSRMRDRARKAAMEQLDRHFPSHLPESSDRLIRASLPIRLDRRSMSGKR